MSAVVNINKYQLLNESQHQSDISQLAKCVFNNADDCLLKHW